MCAVLYVQVEDFAFSRWGVEFFPSLLRFKFSHEAEKNTKHFQIELAPREKNEE